MKKTLLGLGVAALCLGAIGHASAAELVTNGTFETGSFSGWTQLGNTANTFVDNAAAHAGLFGAELGPAGLNGILSQNLSTVAGQSYTISFWLKTDGSVPNSFSADFNGDTIFSTFNLSATPYTQYSFTDTATGSSTAFQLNFHDNSGLLKLDDVSVIGPTTEKGAVPEPGTVATVIMGAFMVGALMVRRRVFTKSL